MTLLPVTDTAIATSDTNGIVTFKFAPPRLGFSRNGSVQVPTAVPVTALHVLWTATIGPATWGSWYDGQSSGPIQYMQGLTVTGVGLAASTSFQAIFTGFDTDQPVPVAPAPTPAPPVTGPQIIVNGSFTLSGGGTATLGPNAIPVTVGTSLEIDNCFFSGNAGRLQVTWYLTNPGLSLLFQTFDLPASVAINGWVIPVLAPWVQFSAAGTAGGGVAITVLTGMPPISQSPVVPDNVLFDSGGALVGAGGSVIMTPSVPYVGPITITGIASTGTVANNTCGVILQTAPYTAPTTWTATGFIEMFRNAPGGTQLVNDVYMDPVTINIPPRICRLVGYNGDSVGHNFYVQGIVP